MAEFSGVLESLELKGAPSVLLREEESLGNAHGLFHRPRASTPRWRRPARAAPPPWEAHRPGAPWAPRATGSPPPAAPERQRLARAAGHRQDGGIGGTARGGVKDASLWAKYYLGILYERRGATTTARQLYQTLLRGRNVENLHEQVAQRLVQLQ
jgi:hypothetical protein